MSQKALDTVALVREFRHQQRERGRFNFQRVAVDSAMAVGLLAVGWLGVKVGLGLYEFTKIVQDPVAAAADAARGVLLAEKRVRLAALQKEQTDVAGEQGRRMGLAREGSFAAKFLGAKTVESEIARLTPLIAEEEAALLELRAEQAVEDEAQPTPGIPMLRSLDRYLVKYGPVAPVAIMGGNILMEILRIRSVRGGSM